MQTEVVARCTALATANVMEKKVVVIHTNSLSSIQTPKKYWPTDNLEPITVGQSLIQMISDNGGSVTIHWIPSHVGITHNERVDEVAFPTYKSAPTEADHN